MPQPSIGRVVHYVSYGTPGGEYGQACRTALITEVGLHGACSLAVLNPTGLFFDLEVFHHEPPAPGTWHWPERVEDG